MIYFEPICRATHDGGVFPVPYTAPITGGIKEKWIFPEDARVGHYSYYAHIELHGYTIWERSTTDEALCIKLYTRAKEKIRDLARRDVYGTVDLMKSL